MRHAGYEWRVGGAAAAIVALGFVLSVPLQAEQRPAPAQPPTIGADREPGSPPSHPKAAPDLDDNDAEAAAPRRHRDADEAPGTGPSFGPGLGQDGCPYRGRKLELIV